MLKKIFDCLIHSPHKLFVEGLIRFARIFPDELYLKLIFWLKKGYKLDLNNPQTFCEKIQWLKLYNRNPKYTQMVDKYEAKKYVASIIGEEYIIPTIGVWNSVEDIDLDKLPNQFVLKTTHGGGNLGVIVCKEKSTFDMVATCEKLKKSLKMCIYKVFREWPYKNIKRRIIAEQYLEEVGRQDLSDYKFFCFNGEPRYCQVIRDRNTVETIDFYDLEWNHMPFVGLNKIAKNGLFPVAKPYHLTEMIEICRKLSKDIPFSRIDLYVVENKVYFGEITFYPASGLGFFTPSEWDMRLGEMIDLSSLKK